MPWRIVTVSAQLSHLFQDDVDGHQYSTYENSKLSLPHRHHPAIRVTELKHGHRDMNRWFITRPGEYEIRLILSALFKVNRGVEAPRRDADGNIIVNVDPLQNGYTGVRVTSNPVTLKVTQEVK